MNRIWTTRVLAWITRVLTIGYAALLTIAWADESAARREPDLSGVVSGDWWWQWAILTHVTPVLIAVAALVFGWRKPAYIAIGFGVLVVIAFVMVGTEFDYLPMIAGPPAVIAGLGVVGWAIAGRRRSR